MAFKTEFNRSVLKWFTFLGVLSGEGLQILAYARHLQPLSSDGSLTYRHLLQHGSSRFTLSSEGQVTNLPPLVAVTVMASKVQFTLNTHKMSWNMAKSVCESQGETLLKIDDNAMRKVAIQYIQDWNITEDIWIGLHRIDATDASRVAWTDCTFDDEEKYDAANNRSDQQWCFVMKTNGNWHLQSCDEEMMFVCRKSLGDCTYDQMYSSTFCSRPYNGYKYGLSNCAIACQIFRYTTGQQCWAFSYSPYYQYSCHLHFSFIPDECTQYMVTSSLYTLYMRTCYQVAKSSVVHSVNESYSIYPSSDCIIQETTTGSLITTVEDTTSTTTMFDESTQGSESSTYAAVSTSRISDNDESTINYLTTQNKVTSSNVITSQNSIASQYITTSFNEEISSSTVTSQESVTGQDITTSLEEVTSPIPVTSLQNSNTGQEITTSLDEVTSSSAVTTQEGVTSKGLTTSLDEVTSSSAVTSQKSVTGQEITTSLDKVTSSSTVKSQYSVTGQGMMTSSPTNSQESVVTHNSITSWETIAPQTEMTSNTKTNHSETTQNSVTSQDMTTVQDGLTFLNAITSQDSETTQYTVTNHEEATVQNGVTYSNGMTYENGETTEKGITGQYTVTSKTIGANSEYTQTTKNSLSESSTLVPTAISLFSINISTDVAASEVTSQNNNMLSVTPGLEPQTSVVTQAATLLTSPQSQGSKSYIDLGSCKCTCTYNVSISLEDKLQAIKRILSVNTKELSSYKRSLISITDSRTSAESVGYSGLSFIIIFVGFFVFVDAINIAMYFSNS